MTAISTGCPDLDGLFKYETSFLTMMYGEAATGKTTLALLETIERARKGKVIFIDTENGFSMERVRQLAPDYERFIENIVRIHPLNFEEQEKIIMNLSERSAAVIIVDTIGFFYRIEVRQDPYKANKSLDNQLRKLNELAKKGVFVLTTNQVYTNLEGKIIVVGGEMVRNWSKCVIWLSKNPRMLKMEKPCELDFYFEIKGEGIVKKD